MTKLTNEQSRTEITKEQYDAFVGLNESYKEMEDRQNEVAPRCHMRPMQLHDDSDGAGGGLSWWECSYCGHVKEIF